jgi:hypothetical protein
MTSEVKTGAFKKREGMKYMGQIQISRRVQVEDERTNSETLV